MHRIAHREHSVAVDEHLGIPEHQLPVSEGPAEDDRHDVVSRGRRDPERRTVNIAVVVIDERDDRP